MMRHVLAAGIVLVSAIAVVHAHNFGTNPPTWNREVSRLVFDKCASCHRPEGTAFSLMTYQDAQPRAVAMKDAVLSRQMPPWGAVKGFGSFRNDQGLSQEQIEVITDWVEGGMLKGNNPNVKAEPPKFDKQPDVIAARGVVVHDGTRLTSDLHVDGLIPGRVPDRKPMQVVAVRPDGAVEPLIWFYEYRNLYRHPFLFRAPVTLPSGTVIRGLPPGATIMLLPPLTELQRATSGAIDVVLLADGDALKEGKSQAALEFRTGNDHRLVDVGKVTVNALMDMANTEPMRGSVFVNPGDMPGRYRLDTDLTMSGTWRLAVSWDGSAGKGSVNFPGAVRR